MLTLDLLAFALGANVFITILGIIGIVLAKQGTNRGWIPYGIGLAIQIIRDFLYSSADSLVFGTMLVITVLLAIAEGVLINRKTKRGTLKPETTPTVNERKAVTKNNKAEGSLQHDEIAVDSKTKETKERTDTNLDNEPRVSFVNSKGVMVFMPLSKAAEYQERERAENLKSNSGRADKEAIYTESEPEKSIREPGHEWKCASCGKYNLIKHQYCVNCGTNRYLFTGAKEQAPEKEDNLFEVEKSTLSFDQISQNMAGKSLESKVSRHGEAQVQMEKKEYIFCKNCGKKIPVDSKFCTWCGTQLTFIKQE